ncbi:hypothetical protein L208DRAFT_1227679, partial [Tricholoma matsutake]
PTCQSMDLASYMHNGVVFSCCSTHLGNSLIMYYPSPTSSTPIAGSIQTTDTSGSQVYLFINCQPCLSQGGYNPFHQYTSFPATLYSSKMDDGPADRVPSESVVSHVALFIFSPDHAVILNLSR